MYITYWKQANLFLTKKEPFGSFKFIIFNCQTCQSHIVIYKGVIDASLQLSTYLSPCFLKNGSLLGS